LVLLCKSVSKYTTLGPDGCRCRFSMFAVSS